MNRYFGLEEWMKLFNMTALASLVWMAWPAAEAKAAQLTVPTSETPCLFGPDASPVDEPVVKGSKQMKIGDQWFDIRETSDGHPFKDYLMRCLAFPTPGSGDHTGAYMAVWAHTGTALEIRAYDLRRKPTKWSPGIWAKMITDHAKLLKEANTLLTAYEAKANELWQACKNPEASQRLEACEKIDAHFAVSSIPADRAEEFLLASYYFSDRVTLALNAMEADGRTETMAAVTWPRCRDYVIEDVGTAKEAVRACDWTFQALRAGITITGADGAEAHVKRVSQAPQQYELRQTLEALCDPKSGHKYSLKDTISSLNLVINTPTDIRDKYYGESFRIPSACKSRLRLLQAEQKKMAVYELPWVDKMWHCPMGTTHVERISTTPTGLSLRVSHKLFMKNGSMGWYDTGDDYSENCEILEHNPKAAKCEGHFEGQTQYRVGNAMVDIVEFYVLPKGGNPLIRQTSAGEKMLKSARCVLGRNLP
jgi:hypothetical protein